MNAPSSQKLNQLFKHHPEVILAYQFGSSTRPDMRVPPKDVDVALVLREKVSAGRRFKIRMDIVERLQTLYKHPVDVAILNDAHIVLVHQVLKSGQLLYGKSNVASDYMVRSLTRYFDYLPLHQFFMQRLAKRLGASRHG